MTPLQKSLGHAQHPRWEAPHHHRLRKKTFLRLEVIFHGLLPQWFPMKKHHFAASQQTWKQDDETPDELVLPLLRQSSSGVGKRGHAQHLSTLDPLDLDQMRRRLSSLQQLQFLFPLLLVVDAVK